jgi:hypothetical protein
MKLRFQESEIRQWADKYHYPLEGEVLALKGPVLKAGCLNKRQLGLVALWKAPRSAKHVDKNTNAYIKEVTAFAFQANDERARIESLTILDGVAWPTASVILHLFHRDPYPILDFRALWSIGLPVPSQYEFSLWWPYVEYSRAVAARNDVDMRTLDRALWQYSKERQKR